MKNTISGMKNVVEDINSREDKAENQIDNLEDKVPPIRAAKYFFYIRIF